MSRPRILLTGAGGFIGGAVSRELSRRGLGFLAPRRPELDLADRKQVLDRFGEHSFDIVFHFASRGVFADANDEGLPAHELAMMESLLDVVAGGGTLFYAGSMTEYGFSGRLSETMACKPGSAYARAKHETGNWLCENARERGVRPVVGRIFGAYGPGEAERRLLPSVIASLRRDEPILLSDGLQIRDFIHVGDVASAAIDLATHNNPPACVNLGTGVGLAVRDVVTRVALALEADLRLLRFGERARSPRDQAELVADTNLLKSVLGITPRQRLAAGEFSDLLICLLEHVSGGAERRSERKQARAAGGGD